MLDLHFALVLLHIIGTSLGVGGATYAEIASLVSKQHRQKVTPQERSLMHANYWMIRAGIVLLVFSGVALVWWHLAEGNTWVLTSPKIWVKDILTFIIILNAFLMARRAIPFWLATSLSLTSWYGALILGAWRGIPYSMFQILAVYCFAVLVVAGFLTVFRKLS